jgi:hypothetical protein
MGVRGSDGRLSGRSTWPVLHRYDCTMIPKKATNLSVFPVNGVGSLERQTIARLVSLRRCAAMNILQLSVSVYTCLNDGLTTTLCIKADADSIGIEIGIEVKNLMRRISVRYDNQKTRGFNLGSQSASTTGCFTRTGTCRAHPRCVAGHPGCHGSKLFRCR